MDIFVNSFDQNDIFWSSFAKNAIFGVKKSHFWSKILLFLKQTTVTGTKMPKRCRQGSKVEKKFANRLSSLSSVKLVPYGVLDP
jgi:hypothetical protein